MDILRIAALGTAGVLLGITVKEQSRNLPFL